MSYGEEIDYEEEERRYLEEQQAKLQELEARNKKLGSKIKVNRGDEEEEEAPKSRSYNLDDDQEEEEEEERNYHDELDPSELENLSLSPKASADDGPVESYLDSETKLIRKGNDSSRWGKGGELFDHTQLEHGSFLDTFEKDQKNNKLTKMSDTNRWGNYKIHDENQLEQGSFLAAQKKHQAEIAEKEKKMKEEKIREIAAEKGDGNYLDPKSNKFPYAELKNNFPKGVDPVKKELYLSSDEFHKVFGISAVEYAKLSAFKKKNMKKQLGLF
ncbi:villin [Acrasis kona]|uniref:Villin n=1 Tax=Acrasis kona TaxID=1008807 RepID=A0AAW2ZHA6_9EUKA